jgi:putative sigma-54 modulation protein
VKVVLHDHTGTLGPELQQYAQRKLSRLERHFGRVSEAEIDFTDERNRGGKAITVCRILVHFNTRRTEPKTARERGVDAQAALDLAIDKIDRQVVKTKELRTHRKQSASPVRIPPEEPAPVRAAEPERIRRKLFARTEEQAMEELIADGQTFHVFLEESSGQIEIVFRREDGSLAILEPVVV